MTELSRTVFVATTNDEDGCVLRSLPQLSGGRDTSYDLPRRYFATYEYFKGALIVFQEGIFVWQCQQ